MAIGNLGDKISRDDMNVTRDLRHPPANEPGYEGGGGDIDFNDGDIFSDIDFSDLDSSDFGGGSSGGQDMSAVFGAPAGNQGGTPVGTVPTGFGAPVGTVPSGFGAPAGTLPNGFGGVNQFGQAQQMQQEPPRRDAFDKAYDTGEEALLHFGKLLIAIIKSLPKRNADDFGYLSRNLIMMGGGMIAVGFVGWFIGLLSSASALKMAETPIQFIGGGMLTAGAGLFGLGFSAYKIAQSTEESRMTVQQLPDISDSIEDDATADYESSVGDILDDLFGDDDEFTLDDIQSTNDEPTIIEEEPEVEPVFAAPVKVDLSKALEEVGENSILSRATLFNTFKNFMPLNTPGFADRKEILEDSDEFVQLETIALKALANVAKCELKDIASKLESAHSTYFSYELRLKRVRGLKNTDEIGKELEAYFRSGSSDTTVNATVDIEGDFYKAIITKGETAVVTFGDMFRLDYVTDFFLDEDNKLPMVLGINELGKVMLADAKLFDTMLIAGKPRSGKSWYVFSTLMSLAMYNSPEMVQFIVIDPKESNLFNTFALMPHVAGLHNDSNILEVMEDIIEHEGPRRKKLLADNKCDDIWALRKKGIKLPVLYLVIDEYITVRNNLGPLDKELDNKLQVIISQLASIGCRLIFVPHRALGVVNRTNRTMIHFTAAVKSDTEDVKDTLGISKWNHPLTKPGDIAVKTSASPNAMYVRGPSLTTSDEDNAELMRNIAKAFYKMGVDIPDMSNMQIACNRDEDYVREELQENGNRIQYSASNIFSKEDE